MRFRKFLFLIAMLFSFFCSNLILKADEVVVNTWEDIEKYIDMYTYYQHDVLKLGSDIDWRHQVSNSLRDENSVKILDYMYEVKLRGNLTIDLNGHNLNFNQFGGLLITALSNDVSFNIVDTSPEKTGSITAPQTVVTLFYVRSCTTGTCNNVTINFENIDFSFKFNNLSFSKTGNDLITFPEEDGVQKININNVAFFNNRLIKGYPDLINLVNVVIKHPLYDETITNYDLFPRIYSNGYDYTLRDMIPEGYKIVKDFEKVNLDDNSSDLKLSFLSDLYIIKDIDLIFIDKLDNKTYGDSTKVSKPVKFVNDTNSKIDIKNVYLENDSYFDLEGSTNISLLSGERDESSLIIKVKDDVDPGEYFVNVVAVDEEDNIYIGNTSVKVEYGKLAIPSVVSSMIFEGDGTLKEIVLDGYDEDTMDLEGVLSASEVGTYKVVITPKDGYVFADGVSSFEFEWEIFERIDINYFKIVNNDYVTLGNEYQMKVTIEPGSATHKDVVWSVENISGSASISKDGILVPSASGLVKVKVQSTYYSDLYDEKEIMVLEPSDVERIMVTTDNYYLESLQACDFKAYVYPADASDVIWSVSDTDKASIDNNGHFISKKSGVVTVRATSSSNSNVYGEADVLIYSKGSTILAPVGKGTQINITSNIKSYNMKWVYSNESLSGPGSGASGFHFAEIPYRYSTYLVPSMSGYTKVELYFKDEDRVIDYKDVYAYNEIEELNSQYDEIILELDEKMQLDISSWVSGIGESTNGVYFTTKDMDIVSVDTNGRLTAKALGNTTLEIFSKYNGIKKVIPISVVSDKSNFEVMADSMKIIGQITNLKVGEKFAYSVEFTPANTTNKEVTWSVINGSGRAEIDENGVLTALEEGSVTLVANSVGTPNLSVSKIITLKKYIDVEEIHISSSKLYLDYFDTIYLRSYVYPSESTRSQVKWTSSNPNIASIDPETGKLTTSYNSGEVTITATAIDGSEAFGTIKLYVGYTAIPSGVETPVTVGGYVPYEEVSWKIGDESVLESTGTFGKTSYNGEYRHSVYVIGLKDGSTTVSILTPSGSLISSLPVRVYTPIKEIISDKASLNLSVNETEKLNISTNPSTVSSMLSDLIFYSNNPNVASVSSSGEVKARGNGKATIYVYSKYYSKVLSIPVVVSTFSESLELDSYDVSLNRDNNTHTIVYTVLPEDAVNKEVTFESADTSVATVTEDGVIEAVWNGTTTVTVKTKDGRHTKEITVVVSDMEKDINSLEFSSVSDVTFNDSEHTPSVDIADGDYGLVKDKDYTITYQDNINAGEASIVITGKGIYKGTKVIKFNILKKDIQVDYTSSDKTVTYDENMYGIDINISSPDNAVIKYADANGDYVLSDAPKYSNAGTYKIKYQISINDNYTVVTGENTLVIEKADIQYSSSNNHIVYDGNMHGINISVSSPVSAVIKYADVNGDYVLDEMPQYKDLGRYEIKYQISAGDNYNVVTSSNQLVISNLVLDIEYSSSDKTVTYDGNMYGIDISVSDPVSAVIKYADVNGDYVLDEIPQYKDAGTYLIKYQISAGDDYNTVTDSNTLVIEKANYIDNSTDKSVLYDGNMHGIDINIQGDYDIKYSTFNDTDYSLTSMPEYKDPGVYKINYKVTNKNYNDYVSSKVLTIIGVASKDTSVVMKNNRLVIKNFNNSFNSLYDRIDFIGEYTEWKHLDSSKNGSEKDSIKTGDFVDFVIDESNSYSYQIVVLGDINGDGKVSALDYVKLKNSIMGTPIVGDIYLMAADVNEDGRISTLDYVRVKNYIMEGGN